MYKQSKFNLYFERESDCFLYNSHTGSFVTLDQEYRKSFQLVAQNNISELPQMHIENFLNAGFIVSKDTDENLIYKYLTNKTKYSSDTLGLTIATTLQCNFRCPYCYEEHLDSYFNEEKEQELKNSFLIILMEKSTRNNLVWRRATITEKMIDRVSKDVIKYCDDNKIEYYADMVSNGYLLNRETAKDLVSNNKIRSVQITLDGGPETHNKTRFLRNGEGTFDKILENIKNIVDLINVVIRVNVSQQNIDDIHKLLPILIENGLNKKVSLYMSPVTDSEQSCQSVSETCLKTDEFSKWEMELIEYADKLGFDMGKMYPNNLGGSVCTAVNNGTFVIDSNGDIYKCWNEVGKPALKSGTLSEGITKSNRFIKWIEWSFPDKCMECTVFPLCKGRCPDMSLEGQDFECAQIKYNIVNRLLRFHKLESNQEKVVISAH